MLSFKSSPPLGVLELSLLSDWQRQHSALWAPRVHPSGSGGYLSVWGQFGTQYSELLGGCNLWGVQSRGDSVGWGCDNKRVESCLHLLVSFLRTTYGLLGFHAVTSSWLSDVRIAYECSVPALPIANDQLNISRCPVGLFCPSISTRWPFSLI